MDKASKRWTGVEPLFHPEVYLFPIMNHPLGSFNVVLPTQLKAFPSVGNSFFDGSILVGVLVPQDRRPKLTRVLMTCPSQASKNGLIFYLGSFDAQATILLGQS